jgi:uncharacterized protein (TIGR02001 family)
MHQPDQSLPPCGDTATPTTAGRCRRPHAASCRTSALLLATLFCAPATHAEWSGELRLLSDYIHRGYSLSRGEPSVQAGLRYRDGTGWIAGATLSRTAFHDDNGGVLAEIRPSIVRTLPLDPDWRGEFGLAAYLYSGDVFEQQSSYAQGHVALHYRNWFSATALLAPNAYGRKADVPSAEISLRQDLSDTLQVSGGAGYTRASRLLEQDYAYWNLGLSWFPARHVALDLRYLDAGIHTHQGEIYAPDEFYPRPQDHRYQISLTIGF